MSLNLSSPHVGAIFDVLHQATGLRFRADTNVPQDRPILASVSGAKVPAWGVMEQLERATGGRWAAEEGGYCLHGPEPAATSPWSEMLSGRNVLWASAGALGALCILLAAWVWWARRGPAGASPVGKK
jgi:hypothetical protein